MTTSVLAFGLGAPGLPELVIFGTIALLLFGKRLPEVARSLGKGIVEFKKGVRGIEDEVSTATYANPTSSAPRPTAPEEPEVAEVTAPKFEPPKFDINEEDVTT
jgi:sec-independent protein translocase protein TatA